MSFPNRASRWCGGDHLHSSLELVAILLSKAAATLLGAGRRLLVKKLKSL
jgi:hypothetical protein